MAYKSLITVMTNAESASGVLPAAASVAQEVDAHLEVMCLGVDCSPVTSYYGGATAMIIEQSMEQARRAAAAISEATDSSLARRDLRWGRDENIARLVELPQLVAAHARFCDLAILPRPYGPDCGPELETCVEACLFDARIPTLVLPGDAPEAPKLGQIAIAWNESAEALNAVKAALPLMARADTVHVVVIDPPQHGPDRSDPGGMLSQYLARHGLRVEVEVLSRTLPRISDVLMRHVDDLDADLLVMGAYGHSRFREAVFGGATRDMLGEAPVPLFMAH